MNKFKSYYLNSFLGLNCAPDLLAKAPKKAWNVKEVSEAMMIRNYIMNNHLEKLSNRRIAVLDVGCGKAALLSLLLAHTTPWNIFAIDPRIKRAYSNVSRLTTSHCTLEHFLFYPENIAHLSLYDHVFGIFLHAHVKCTRLIDELEESRVPYTIIGVPCCEKLGIEEFAVKTIDHNCISHKNEMYTIEGGLK